MLKLLQECNHDLKAINPHQVTPRLNEKIKDCRSTVTDTEEEVSQIMDSVNLYVYQRKAKEKLYEDAHYKYQDLVQNIYTERGYSYSLPTLTPPSIPTVLDNTNQNTVRGIMKYTGTNTKALSNRGGG